MNRDKLRKLNLRWIEQLCNADTTRINTWICTTKLLKIETRGRIPRIYKDIRTKIVDTTDPNTRALANPGNKHNPFKLWEATNKHKAKELKKHRLDWLAIKSDADPIIGHLRKRRQHVTTIRHYIQKNNTSPIEPCREC